ncbi:efflux RND transporter periplasmic adaptor subunit [Pseudobutyrivibrio sp.]|uniref:efflux RND transporter periplasmic adaptor subunit n=1 Tax=Pseudobutyrivibrio sp. TaxID=2014367 RepID=UPI0025DAF848|nr:efflux RND transporter periplasmic adaptor subunit [Pseudobutyrivibrio sp.]
MSKIGDNNAPKKDSKIKGFFKRVGGFLKKHKKLFIILVIVLCVYGYFRHNAKKAAEMLAEQANQPVTATVENMDLTQSVSVTGKLTANNTKTITSTIGSSGVTGVKVAQVNYEVGDYVEAGTVVVEFDSDDYNRKLAELNANHAISDAQAVVNLDELNKNILDTQKKLEDTQKYLDENKDIYDNVKALQDDYDTYGAEAYGARYSSEDNAIFGKFAMHIPAFISDYEAKRDSIADLQFQIEAYQNKIELANMQQNYDQTYTQVDELNDVYKSMDKTQVATPISGYIISMDVEEGNNYTQGNSVFTIADTSGFIVEATVNEYDIANIKEDLPVAVKFEATGDEEFSGTVSFVSVASTTTVSGGATQAAQAAAGGSTGTGVAEYKVKITLDGTDDRLRVGMTAKASVILDKAANVLAVPYDCVQEAEDGSYFVTVIGKDGSKKDVPVTRGLESDYYVEISGDGIDAGTTVEAVVSDGPSTDMMDYVTFE